MGSSKERFLKVATALAGLGEVETTIQSKLISDARLLHEIPRYLLSLGGKRVRPMLTLLAHRLFSDELPRALIDVAAGIELIHMATLLHDDIIDRSPLRRHKTSPFFVYGLPGTLLAGDFLLVRAFALCAHLDEFIIDATERACVELTEGEILETSLDSEPHTVESSLRIAQKKTASLFRLSCESAGHIARLPQDNLRALAVFGEQLGIAFQIVDDILDIVSSEEELGKKPGTDIKEKKPSMVNVLWLASGDADAEKALKSQDTLTDAEIDRLVGTLKRSVVLERAREYARSHVAKAEQALQSAIAMQQVNPTVLEALKALTQYALERME